MPTQKKVRDQRKKDLGGPYLLRREKDYRKMQGRRAKSERNPFLTIEVRKTRMVQRSESEVAGTSRIKLDLKAGRAEKKTIWTESASLPLSLD